MELKDAQILEHLDKKFVLYRVPLLGWNLENMHFSPTNHFFTTPAICQFTHRQLQCWVSFSNDLPSIDRRSNQFCWDHGYSALQPRHLKKLPEMYRYRPNNIAQLILYYILFLYSSIKNYLFDQIGIFN